MPIGAAIGQAGAINQAWHQSNVSKTAWSRTKRMMKKRHQWEVRDLRKAGLNPILSAGAAPSMGSNAQASPIQTPDGSAFNAGMANREKRKMGQSQRTLLTEQVAATRAGAAKHNSDVELNDAQIVTQGHQASYLSSQTEHQNIQNEYARHGLGRRATEAARDATWAGKAMIHADPYLRGFRDVGIGVGAIAAGVKGIGGVGGSATRMGTKLTPMMKKAFTYKKAKKGHQTRAWINPKYNNNDARRRSERGY